MSHRHIYYSHYTSISRHRIRLPRFSGDLEEVLCDEFSASAIASVGSWDTILVTRLPRAVREEKDTSVFCSRANRDYEDGYRKLVDIVRGNNMFAGVYFFVLYLHTSCGQHKGIQWALFAVRDRRVGSATK